MSRRITGIGLACIGVIIGAFLVCAAPAHAAVTTLKAGKAYSIDLNGGKKEQVKYTFTRGTLAKKSVFRLYVNGKKVLTKRFGDEHMVAGVDQVKVADTNKKDRYQEIFLGLSGDQSNSWVNVIQYRSAKKVKYYSKASGVPSDSRLSLWHMKAPGNGTVYLESDTPYHNFSFGSYYMLAPMKLSGKTMKYMKATSYALWSGWSKSDISLHFWGKSSLYDVYTLKRSMTLYRNAKVTNSKGTLFSGTSFKPLKLHVANLSAGPSGYRNRADFHVYVKTSNGTKGWLSFPKNGSGYLLVTPAWG